MRTMIALVCAALLSRASCSEPMRAEEPTSSAVSGGAARADYEDEQNADGGPRRRAPREVGARHILVMHVGSERAPATVTRTRDEAEVRAAEALRRARAGEDFPTLVREFSDEPGAAGRGGSLGRFGRGRMVGAFEDAAFALEVNEISNVIETPFGFHVILRTE